MEVMANGWLLLGTQEAESQLIRSRDEPAKVRDFDINDCTAWTRHARKMARAARQNGDSEATIVRYLRVREHQTRQVAIKYWRDQKYPWGEALKQALAFEMAVLWTITAQTNTYGVQVNIPGITDVIDQEDRGRKRARSPRRSPTPPPHNYPPPKRQGERQPPRKEHNTIPKEYLGIASKNLQAYMLCTDFNGRGCRCDKPSLCPQGKLHRCSFVLSDGTLQVAPLEHAGFI